jgi:hypothetical protein
MIKPTRIPAMMQSAYARIGKAPIYQILVLGLGMDRTACSQLAVTTLFPSRPVSFSSFAQPCDRPYANSGFCTLVTSGWRS